MSKTRKRRLRRRRSSGNRSELAQHIHALGLSGPQEYDEWCQRHGFQRLPHKDWRQLRAEHELADALQARETLERHILALGCGSVEDYRDWCLDRGFEPSLDPCPNPSSSLSSWGKAAVSAHKRRACACLKSCPI